MRKVLLKLVKLSSLVLSVFFRITAPFSKLFKRLWYLAKAQSQVKFSIPVSTQFDGAIQIIGTGNIIWGEHCRFGKGVVLETEGDGLIELGDHVRINQGSVLVAHSKITLGDDCLVGEYCSIRDANHSINAGELIRTQGHSMGAIVIEDDCWVARGSVVLKGVVLHQGCVVGANSVVTKSVSSNTVAVGVPCKEVRLRD